MGVFTDRILKKKNSNGLRKLSCKREILTLSKLAEEGKITIAKDKLLSFVNELNIVNCYMYGDLLTKFVFDNTNEKFKEIGECQVRYVGGLGEYERKNF